MVYIFAAPPSDWYNVKNYGAMGDSTTGADGHDDTANIQAAYDAACATGGTVYFPRGQYRITSRLTPTSLTQEAHVRFTGNPGAVNQYGSRIIGNFNDYLLCTGSHDPIANNDGIPGVCAIDNLGFQNFHATGSCILIGWGNCTNIVNCFFYSNNVGVRVPHGICVKCDSCNFTGGGSTDSGSFVGLAGSTGLWDVTQAVNCRIAGYDRAYMCGETGTTATEPNVILGCSFETNNTAIKSILGGSAALITANQFESNRVSIDWNGAGVSIMSNWISAPNGSAITGIVVGALAGGALIAGNSISIVCSNAGIDLSNVVGHNVVVQGNFCNVPSGGGTPWKMPTSYVGGKTDISFLGNNNPYSGVVFANLPDAPIEGWEYECSDSPTTSVGNFGATVATGGGSNHVKLRWTGSVWRIAG